MNFFRNLFGLGSEEVRASGLSNRQQHGVELFVSSQFPSHGSRAGRWP